MDRRMLINATHSEECRIAIVEEGQLVELEIESESGKKLKGNIYKARISRIEPSLQAAFIDIGTSRNGFLQVNDVHPSYFRLARGRNGSAPSGRPRIQDALEAGQEIIVQVVKEEREMKGATLTTYLSLPGRYVVLMPGSDRGGISRKISDGEQRKRLRSVAEELEMPVGIGMIIRTAGLDRSLSELSRDVSLQLKVWEGIVRDAQMAPSPTCLYEESDLSKRVIRDYFTPEVREILIDNPETFEQVRQFVGEVMPRYRSRIKRYDEERPIFSAFGIEEQVLSTMRREVKLPSGGALVVDTLEALVAIDVNSGKSTGGENIEETAYKTNMEAADEIARQLRLRDLGGLIVVDFIDMMDRRHKAAIERKMRDAVRGDKARIEVGRLSRFGLLEMSRQRLRASLSSQSHLKCSHCQGVGHVRNPELVALEVLRKIQTAVSAGHLALVKARMSPTAAMFLLNNKKSELVALETHHRVRVFVLADGRLSIDEYDLEIEASRQHAVSSTSPSGTAKRALPSAEGPQKIAPDPAAEPPQEVSVDEETQSAAPSTLPGSPESTPGV